MKYNDIVYFVFINIGIGKGWGYLVYLYGYLFEFLKMGFLIYNRIIGNIIIENEEIKCIKRWNDYCMFFIWSDFLWINGNVLGLNFVNLFLKDMVVIFRGGYVVIRIWVNNFGFWLFYSFVDY